MCVVDISMWEVGRGGICTTSCSILKACTLYNVASHHHNTLLPYNAPHPPTMVSVHMKSSIVWGIIICKSYTYRLLTVLKVGRGRRGRGEDGERGSGGGGEGGLL